MKFKKIIKYCFILIYRDLSHDQGFVDQARNILRYALAILLQRMQKVSFVLQHFSKLSVRVRVSHILSPLNVCFFVIQLKCAAAMFTFFHRL